MNYLYNCNKYFRQFTDKIIYYVFKVEDEENLKSIADDILTKLHMVTDPVIAKARQDLIATESTVNKTAADVEGQAKSALNVLQDSFKKELDELKAKAKKAGVNIDSCLGEDEKKLVTLASLVESYMISCVQSLTLNTTGLANDALTKV